jgi:hypothetical protein
MARISVSSAKDKGREFQKWVARMISELTGIPWGKDELIASREGAQSGTDIRLIGEAKKQFPFSVECKAQESWSVHEWINQAVENQEPGTDWLLFCRRGRKKGQPIRMVVIMDADAFFRTLGRFHDQKNRTS